MSRITHCPACAAPVSPRAVLCALCDHVIDADRLAAATRAADRRSSRAVPRVNPWGGIARAALSLAAVALLLWVVAGVSVAAVAASQSRSSTARVEREVADRLTRIRREWPRVDEVTRLVAAPARTSDAVDREALRALVAAMIERRRAGWGADTTMAAAFDADPSAVARLGALAPSAAGDARRAPPRGALASQLVRDGAAGRLADSLRVRLEADSATPWLAVWRRVAQGGEPVGEWQLREGAPGLAGPIGAPIADYNAYKALAGANASAALLEASRGWRRDREDAVRRARENVAMARLLMRGGSTLGFHQGRLLLDAAGALLAHVGRLTSDSAAVADGEAVLRAAEPLEGLRVFFWPTLEAADDAAPALVALAGDRALPPGMRADAVMGVILGSCHRTGEVLMGLTSTREDAARRAVAALADVDPERRLRPLYERAVDEYRRVTEDGGSAYTGQQSTFLTLLGSVGLGSVAGRAMVCTNL